MNRKFFMTTHMGHATAKMHRCFALDTDKAADQGHVSFHDSQIGDIAPGGHGHIDHA